jgi:hypothetical protein
MWWNGVPEIPMVEIEVVTIVNRMSGPRYRLRRIFDYRVAETGKLKRYPG